MCCDKLCRSSATAYLKLVHILKSAIKSQYDLLSANVKLATEPWTLATLKEKIFELELKDERILLGLPRSTQDRAQANFSSSAGQGRATTTKVKIDKLSPSLI